MNNPRQSTTVYTEAVGEGLGVYDTRTQKSHILNATAALIWQQCDGETSPQQLTKMLQQKFNIMQAQAEQLTWAALDELAKANLLQDEVTSTQAPQPVLSRRQMLHAMAAAGLSLALLPLVSPVVVQAAEGDVIPTLQCVDDNGDGTYTAHFGYINNSSLPVTILQGTSKNMFTANPKDRGQPSLFMPGIHEDVFQVVFDGNKITWLVKEDQAKRQQVDADSDSEPCAPPPTTTVLPPPTQPPPPPTTTILPI